MCSEFLNKMSRIWCVSGLGRTAPDPGATVSFKGVDVPLGKGANTNIDDTSLLYNEYPFYSGLVIQKSFTFLFSYIFMNNFCEITQRKITKKYKVCLHK